MGEIARRALPRVESTRSLLQAAGRFRLPGLHGLFDLAVAKRPGTPFPDPAAATEMLEVLIYASSGASELSLPAARLCDEAIARVIPELAADPAVSDDLDFILSAAAKLLGYP